MRFSVLTYNVLHSWGASRLLRSRPNSDPAWARDRLLRVAELVRRLSPDAACLQELDEVGHLALERELGEEFVCAAAMRNEELPPKDGCAVFVRRSKFDVASAHSWRLRDVAERHCPGAEAARAQAGGMAAALWRELHEKLSLGLAVRLRPRREGAAAGREQATSGEVLVSTCHLFWDPRYPDVKLLQAFLLAREMDRLGAGHAPVVLAGDFNSTPLLEPGQTTSGAMSGVYELLTTGHVAVGHPHHPATLRPGSGILRGVAPADVPELTVSPFRSAYAEAQGREGPITNASQDFSGCLDYVFFRGSPLRLLGVRPLPNEAELPRGTLLPSTEHPSDHLPLLAEFELEEAWGSAPVSE